MKHTGFRLGHLIPVTGLDDDERKRWLQALSTIGGNMISSQLLEIAEGPEFIESVEDEEKVVSHLVRLAIENEDEFDAYIVECFGDVGVTELRRSVKIPIIGPCRAAFTIAAAVFPSFSLLALNRDLISYGRRIAGILGLQMKLKEVAVVDLPVREIIAKPDHALALMEDKAKSIEDVAIIPGCMSMAMLLYERRIERLGSCIVVNPLTCAIEAAAAIVL